MMTAIPQPALGGKIYRATVMVVDIEDFLSIAKALPLDELGTFLNDFYRTVGDVILAHGGYIDKYMNDTVVALFNVPEALPHHEEEAVRAALAMQVPYAAFLDRWQLDGHRLSVGIDTGDVLAGYFGHPARSEFTAFGTTVHRAMVIQSSYVPDVFIGESTCRAVKHLFPTRPFDQLGDETVYEVLKGASQ
ncbi:MAG: adenylate/guanylate cyclase domain-containing protein [Candidatus Sericytochromatia bacterium]|nr:adenylate/guanylate cyclase domain-containing protein [Candidatus Sericytochromatia bacterium]